MISPRSASAMATNWPPEATWTIPRKMEASVRATIRLGPFGALPRLPGSRPAPGCRPARSRSAEAYWRNFPRQRPLYGTKPRPVPGVSCRFRQTARPGFAVTPKRGPARPAPGRGRGRSSAHRCLCRIRRRVRHGLVGHFDELEPMIVTARGASSTVSPSRARWSARSPSILTAEKRGGTCSMVPVKRGKGAFDRGGVRTAFTRRWQPGLQRHRCRAPRPSEW